MTLWRLGNPGETRSYAQASRRGTWGKPITDVYAERLKPLVVEWKPGPQEIGDFTWPGFDDDVMVKRSVGEELVARFSGVELSAVEMVQGEVKRLKSGKTNGVALPYDGPPLNDLWITGRCPRDPERTTVGDTGAVLGAEHFAFRWNSARTGREQWRVPREPGRGVYVRLSELGGTDIFRVDGFIWAFCTEEVRRFVEDRKFTNVACLEVGGAI